jgi:hypothetical protein
MDREGQADRPQLAPGTRRARRRPRTLLCLIGRWGGGASRRAGRSRIGPRSAAARYTFSAGLEAATISTPAARRPCEPSAAAAAGVATAAAGTAAKPGDVRRGALEGMQFPLLPGELMSIGRSSDSKIFLDDVTVSRKHASVSLSGSDWVLTDAGSLNGTYVNKMRVSSTTLVNGDELQIGKFRFIFVLAPSAGH